MPRCLFVLLLPAQTIGEDTSAGAITEYLLLVQTLLRGRLALDCILDGILGDHLALSLQLVAPVCLRLVLRLGRRLDFYLLKESV